MSNSDEEMDVNFKTDVVDYDLPHIVDGVETVCYNGMPKIELRFWKSFQKAASLMSFITKLKKHPINILDARYRNLDYEKSGITKCNLESEVTDWEKVEIDNSPEQNTYKAELREIIKKLHPQAKKIEFYSFIRRGGGGQHSNPPAKDEPHLDYYQDSKACHDYTGTGPEYRCEEGFESRIILGIWKPIDMKNEVYDYPLVFLDASTFDSDRMVRFEQDFTHFVNGKEISVKNLAANLKYDKKQKWYYYSKQNVNEVAIFRHYTKGQFKANVHCSIQQDLPLGCDTRCSIETRAVLFW